MEPFLHSARYKLAQRNKNIGIFLKRNLSLIKTKIKLDFDFWFLIWQISRNSNIGHWATLPWFLPWEITVYQRWYRFFMPRPAKINFCDARSLLRLIGEGKYGARNNPLRIFWFFLRRGWLQENFLNFLPEEFWRDPAMPPLIQPKIVSGKNCPALVATALW